MGKINERIEDDKIIIDGSGRFPKEFLIFDKDKNGKYRVEKKRILKKTRSGGYQLT